LPEPAAMILSATPTFDSPRDPNFRPAVFAKLGVLVEAASSDLSPTEALRCANPPFARKTLFASRGTRRAGSAPSAYCTAASLNDDRGHP
jgi:hypothetical protein